MNEFPVVKIKQIKPKYCGQRCPVCNGFGTLKFGQIKCHACIGKGYILIPVERDRQKNERTKN